MPLLEAEAVVLRQYSLAEADRIVVLFTREYGILRAVGAGARKTGSRLSAAIEPLNHIRLEVSVREGRDLAHIRECEILRSYLGRNATPERVCAFSYFAELVAEFIQENYPAPLVFRLLLASMSAAEITGISNALVRYFEIWILKLNGLFPDYDYCSHCGQCVKGNGFFAFADTGRARCAACARGEGICIGPASAATLLEIFKRPPHEFASIQFPGHVAREMEMLTQTLLGITLGKPLKAYPGLREILRNG